MINIIRAVIIIIMFAQKHSQKVALIYLWKIEGIYLKKIILDYEFKSFKRLFSDGKNIEQISFKKFNRKDITDMSNMFSYCNSLTNIDLSNFNTQNVANMNCMFQFCKSLKPS